MEGSRRRNPRDVGDVAGESSRSDQKIQRVGHFVVVLFLCLRDGSGLNCHLNGSSTHLPFSIYPSTILVPVRGSGSGVTLGRVWALVKDCGEVLRGVGILYISTFIINTIP